MALINHLVADGVELGQLVDQIVAYLRGVLFMRVARAPEQLDLPQDVVVLMGRQAETLTPTAILTALREFTEARAALRDQVPGVPQLPINDDRPAPAVPPIAVPEPGKPAAADPSVSTAAPRVPAEQQSAASAARDKTAACGPDCAGRPACRTRICSTQRRLPGTPSSSSQDSAAA